MSCQQQLLQEDPYIFTDTISNSTNFIHEHNSQTKYVPLNRQTIYNRQFRQHEPTIASSPDSNGSKSSSPKIIISPSSLKKNGHITTINRTSPPKFFKTQQQQQQNAAEDIKIKKEIDDVQTNHSIASQSVSLNLPDSHQQNNHVSKFEKKNDISGITTTGIIQEEITGKLKKCDENKARRKQQRKNNRHITKNVLVEPVININSLHPESTVINRNFLETLTRDERLKIRKSYFRNVLDRYESLYYKNKERREISKRHFLKTCKLLKAMNKEREEMKKKSFKKCFMRECGDGAIPLSDYCSKHILKSEKEQFLIRQCCFLHADGQQCRVPVYDVMATVAVCNDHLNAPQHQLVNASCVDTVKPKKPQIQRKRNKTNSPMIRPVKKGSTTTASATGRNNKKIPATPIKFSPLSSGNNISTHHHRPTMIIHPNDINKKTKTPAMSLLPLKMENLIDSNHQFIHHNSGNLLASSQSSYGSMSGNEDLYLKQDLMTAVCENSYESSEDTGVGGLSENELMSNDVIGNFDMESCAELSKVLSSLPSNTLDDLLTEPLHASRDDEEYLDRAIEEVSASGMDQIAITAFEHLEGLDMLEMLDDDEQRQMISAATNLISMSGYLSHEQDNNYSAMPSPMMS